MLGRGMVGEGKDGEDPTLETLTPLRMLEGSTTHWGLLGGTGEGQHGAGELGRDSMGRNARYG